MKPAFPTHTYLQMPFNSHPFFAQQKNAIIYNNILSQNIIKINKKNAINAFYYPTGLIGSTVEFELAALQHVFHSSPPTHPVTTETIKINKNTATAATTLLIKIPVALLISFSVNS